MNIDFYYMYKHINTSKKGIAPVIAVVILVGVSVAIAAPLAGFSSSLFDTYSHTEVTTITKMVIDVDGDGSMELVNAGAQNDSVVSIHVPGGNRASVESSVGDYDDLYLDAAGDCGSNGRAPEVKANSEATVCFLDLDSGGDDSNLFVAGQVLTVKVKMASGVEHTHMVIVKPLLSGMSDVDESDDDDDDDTKEKSNQSDKCEQGGQGVGKNPH
ncbi:MAG: hypothetical protein ACE5J2_01725, partial [Nitrososphaerales archaeon]